MNLGSNIRFLFTEGLNLSVMLSILYQQIIPSVHACQFFLRHYRRTYPLVMLSSHCPSVNPSVLIIYLIRR